MAGYFDILQLSGVLPLQSTPRPPEVIAKFAGSLYYTGVAPSADSAAELQYDKDAGALDYVGDNRELILGD